MESKTLTKLFDIRSITHRGPYKRHNIDQTCNTALAVLKYEVKTGLLLNEVHYFKFHYITEIYCKAVQIGEDITSIYMASYSDRYYSVSRKLKDNFGDGMFKVLHLW